MPDRILRSNILTSDAVNSLSWTAEVFYRRLMSIVDDFGRYDARSEILRSQLYPLKLDNVSKSDIVKWLNECSKAGLIRLYSTDGRGYLEILKFNQRLRAMKSKFPSPADKCGHLTADDDRQPPEYETETESETETEITPNGVDDSAESSQSPPLIPKYEVEKGKDLKYVHAYIQDYKPTDHQPYVDLWNIFAEKNKKSKIRKLSESWKKKLHIRLKDKDFNLSEILKKAKNSDFLISGSWFSFNWLIENDHNFLKVIQGDYDNKKDSTNATTTARQEPTAAEQKGAALIASVLGDKSLIGQSAATGS